MTSLNNQLKPTLTLEPAFQSLCTVQDYHRMSELGILNSDERTELIAGKITLMTAKGTRHVTTLRLLGTAEDELLAEQTVFVTTHDHIQLDDFLELEPDLAIGIE
ncbi:MAG: Uma2 family endonuclease [Xenococcus sp. MO_188.B8]|nr:Uma2 family endonuclease [Xenococcus sp. MO_188.B8]